MTDLYTVAADQLRSYIERYEALEVEKQDIADQQKEVLAKARWAGYDVKALREIIKLRKKRADERAEREALLQLYLDALDMG